MSRLSIVVMSSAGALLLCMAVRTARATDPPPTSKPLTAISFAKDVFPILQRSCLECHGEKKQAGDFRLDQPQAAFQSGHILPGKSGASESLSEKGSDPLRRGQKPNGNDSPPQGRTPFRTGSEMLRRVSLPRGDEEVMPAIGEPLSKTEVAVLRSWIEQGAAWPEDFAVARHWSYNAPQRPALSSAPETVALDVNWSKSPLDQFVLRRLADEGLVPSPAATAEKLVRRLFLDLIGLPPTPAEVQAYVAEPTEQHYQQLVEDLLRRPQFGERWARPWLDLARYADSHGFQRDDLRDLWAYRDWVIRALNDDMPFDQFTIEQIAGDLLPNPTESQKIATGFHRCAPTNCEAGSLPEETRIEQVIDRVNTTGEVWLGTTLECCQCHDHKYDPFTMKDYYQLLAFYNNTELEADRTDPKTPSSIQFKGPTMPLANAERDRQRAELQLQRADLQQQLNQRRSALQATLETWAQSLAQSADAPQSHVLDVVDFQSTGTTDSFKKLADGSILLVGDDPPDKDITGNVDADAVSSEIVSIVAKPTSNWSVEERQKLLDYRILQDKLSIKSNREIAKLDKQITKLAADTTLLMVERDRPRLSTLFVRGDYKQPGDPVQPNVPTALHALPVGPANRLTLARWLVAPQNPLVARVTVNRWWAELFGQGIVTTLEDFGIKGEAPSHPELLDWLAVEFMEHGWSMKHVLKTIVMSATYRQSSRVTAELLDRDDRNRLLARGPRFRLDAEMIRDNALAISGLLDLKQFGPSIRPFQPDGIWTKVGGARYDYAVSPGSERHRRGIYVVLKRGAPYPSFVNFDATARLACTVKRSRTNTPLQALTLLNDPVYTEAAKALASRIQTEKADESIDAQVDFAFQLCVARAPTDGERSTIKNLLEAQTAAADLEDAWYSVATVLLNLHETITKD